MFFKKIILLTAFLCVINGFTQTHELSPLSKISILTFGSGEDLYSKFGHTGIRIQDSSLGMDIVFDYGNFASF